MSDDKRTFTIPKPSPDLFRKRTTEDFGHIGTQVEQTYNPATMRDKYRMFDPSTNRYAIAEVDPDYADNQRAINELMAKMMREVYRDDKCGNPNCDLCGNGSQRAYTSESYSLPQRFVTGVPESRSTCPNCERKDREAAELREVNAKADQQHRAEVRQINEQSDALATSLEQRIADLQVERDALDAEANNLAAEYARAMEEIEFLRGELANAA